MPDDLIDRTFAEARRFHDRPLEWKMALRMNEHNNGYMAMNRYAVWTSDVNANTTPDLNEAFFVKRFLGPHIHGHRDRVSADVPGAGQAAEAFAHHLQRLSPLVVRRQLRRQAPGVLSALPHQLHAAPSDKL